ncbi:hypothetical protein N7474_011232 [Penicillium riverlandense]|uniref:uncharacterized protein n=1 Tax=Penicillium riverlandense TaxID=1903569 RepID=UPI0025481F65|nr:uncharacterized protein N7474_011232 [Penicillium riverlandense]KAJ5805345.1 hypothetical protein N7474_011232 [Penicillium riverlandense]
MPVSCLDQVGIGSADHGTYVELANLPSIGTQESQRHKGVSAFDIAPGGETMTVNILGVTYLVTAATYNAKDVDSGGAVYPTWNFLCTMYLYG